MSTPFERCLDMLGDVPGNDLEAKLTSYIGSYMALQIENNRLRSELDQARRMVESGNELGRAASYCLDRLSRAFKGEIVRDMDEAGEAYKSALKNWMLAVASTERHDG